MKLVKEKWKSIAWRKPPRRGDERKKETGRESESRRRLISVCLFFFLLFFLDWILEFRKVQPLLPLLCLKNRWLGPGHVAVKWADPKIARLGNGSDGVIWLQLFENDKNLHYRIKKKNIYRIKLIGHFFKKIPAVSYSTRRYAYWEFHIG